MGNGRKGVTGASTTILRLKKDKEFNYKNYKRRKEQKERLKREEQLYEMIQQPNGDFVKVKRK